MWAKQAIKATFFGLFNAKKAGTFFYTALAMELANIRVNAVPQ
jgi:hypothetical protein